MYARLLYAFQKAILIADVDNRFSPFPSVFNDGRQSRRGYTPCLRYSRMLSGLHQPL